MPHHRFRGERMLMRIFLGERDTYQGKPLYQVIVEKLRERGLAGATVLRGVAGFGSHHALHTDKLVRFALDLPIILEVVETEEAIQSALPELDAMVGSGVITLERVRVVLYRPQDVAPSERERHRIEGLAPDD